MLMELKSIRTVKEKNSIFPAPQKKKINYNFKRQKTL